MKTSKEALGSSDPSEHSRSVRAPSAAPSTWWQARSATSWSGTTGTSTGCWQRCSRDRFSRASPRSHPLSQHCSPTRSGLSYARSAESSSLHWPTAIGRRLILTLSISGMALGCSDHRPHPSICDDRLRSTCSLSGCTHPPGNLGRHRAAERHRVHGRTRSREPEGPVRLVLQHGKRPRDPRSDRRRGDGDIILCSRRPRRLGLAYPVPGGRRPWRCRSHPAGPRR